MFSATAPNRLWVADFTYVSTWRGFVYVLVTWNYAGGWVFVPRCHHELRGAVHCVGDLGREVAGPGPARAGGGVVADLGRCGAGTSHDRRIRSRPDRVSAGVRARGHRPCLGDAGQIVLFAGELRTRPSQRGPKVVVLDSGSGLANATLQQRLVSVRLFYDFLVGEGVRESNPVGRGRYTPGRRFGGTARPLVARMIKLPWIPGEAQWLRLLEEFRLEPIRNRLMLALAYDSALRREELCSLRTDDLDPAHRTLRVRAETTKARWGRVVPYSVATGVLLPGYLAHRAGISRARGPLFLSGSRRNHGEPLSLWTWSKVVRRVTLAADVPQFSTHTTRHLCLTDLARMGWELHDRHLRRGPIDRVDADLHSPVGPRSCGEAEPFDVAPACAAHRHAHRCRRRRDGYHPVRSATPRWPRAEPDRCVAESSVGHC